MIDAKTVLAKTSETRGARHVVTGVAGAFHHDWPRARRAGLRLHAGSPLCLKRCPYNPYDENAIEIHDPAHGIRLGYLKRRRAGVLAPALDAGANVRCYFADVHPRDPDQPYVIIVGDVPEEWQSEYDFERALWIEREARAALTEIAPSPDVLRHRENAAVWQDFHDDARRRIARRRQAIEAFAPVLVVPAAQRDLPPEPSEADLMARSRRKRTWRETESRPVGLRTRSEWRAWGWQPTWKAKPVGRLKTVRLEIDLFTSSQVVVLNETRQQALSRYLKGEYVADINYDIPPMFTLTQQGRERHANRHEIAKTVALFERLTGRPAPRHLRRNENDGRWD